MALLQPFVIMVEQFIQGKRQCCGVVYEPSCFGNGKGELAFLAPSPISKLGYIAHSYWIFFLNGEELYRWLAAEMSTCVRLHSYFH